MWHKVKSLDCFFSPKNVAVIGATERPLSVGRTVVSNLLDTFSGGSIYLINPKHQSLFNQKCYPNIGSVPEIIDLVIIATPAKTVPQIISECVRAKVRAVIILSAGFKEAGAIGIELEEQVLFHARGHLRIIGPNCLGVMIPSNGLNATFAHGMAQTGSVAFISQSGALCTAMIDWSRKEKVGFSALVSIGSMIDVNWSDLIDYFANDPATQSILIYMESIGDAASFLSAARKGALQKPIVLIKAGRHVESAQAVISHTGALVGNDAVFSAAMQSVHVLQVDTIAELFNIANFLDKQPLPKGPHLTMITNAGGPAVIASDALILAGAQLTTFGTNTIEAYDQLLSIHTSHNPVDLFGDATAEKYEKAIQIAEREGQSDGILVILSPQDMTNPTEIAKRFQKLNQTHQPLLASWMGAESVEEGKNLLNAHRIPVFDFPDMAAQVFAKMSQIHKLRHNGDNQRKSITFDVDAHQVDNLIAQARKENRTILDPVESLQIIKSYGIPAVRTEIALSVEEAIIAAKKIGFPVVMKVYSRTITHKSNAGGVKLNIKNEHEVQLAYENIKKVGADHFSGVIVQPMLEHDGIELILGSLFDEQFGSALMFGLGGRFVEAMNDRSIAIPPLSSIDARRMMEQTKIYQALKQFKDCKRLEETLLRLSQLIISHPQIKECDINPLVASMDRHVALDGRFILHSLNSNICPST